VVSFFAVVAGLAMLVFGADRFVLGAAATARNLGVPPLLIGLTVVGVGTSAPEILVSAMASWHGNPGLAIGNAIGSNIANIGLVAGCTALAAPLVVGTRTLYREFPVMFFVIVLAWVLLLNGVFSRLDGVILMTGFVLLLVFMVMIALNASSGAPRADEPGEGAASPMSFSTALMWLALGLLVLLIGSRAIVWGAVNIATALGVSDLVIGLTVVAIGTSLPELAASITSVMKKEPDLAVGNVIGSNMFNLLPVLALPGLIAPGPVPEAVLDRDYPLMLAFSVVLYIMAFGFRRNGRMGHLEGAVLLTGFGAYQGLLYFTAL